MQNIILVTGANKGIGFEVSRQLARTGALVLMGARDAVRGEEAAVRLQAEGLPVRYVPVDLEHAAESGAALAEGLQAEFGRLDVLVNNAGIADMTKDGPTGTVSIETVNRDSGVDAAFAAAAQGRASGAHRERFERPRLPRHQQ